MASARVSSASLAFRSLLGLAALAVIGAVASAGVGCSDDQTAAQQSALATIQSCEYVSANCPAMVPATPMDMATCSASISGECGGEVVTFQNCIANKCTDAGFLDYGAVDIDCNGYQSALEDCLAAAGDGGTTPSGGGGSVIVMNSNDAATVRD